MSDDEKDLVEALRLQGWNDAADRIEQLERDYYRWKMECEEFWRAREAKAVEALRELATCVDDGCYCSEAKMAGAMDNARAVLAELEGE